MSEAALIKSQSRSIEIALLIAISVLGIYFFIATRTTLWDRDEPSYARAAVEMVDSGNYVVPTFNGQVWFDKPPLFLWLMSLPIRIFGPTEFACRFFGVAGTALTCLLVFFTGQRHFGTKAGLWAMVILASTLMMLVIGSAAITDAVLLPFIVAAMAIFAEATCSGVRISHVILMGCALGFGMLAKGPIGLMPIPAIVAILWFNRRAGGNIRRDILFVGGSLIIGLLIFAAWAVPANNSTDGEFYRVFIGRNVINRAFKPMEHHGGSLLLYLPYYLLVIITGFLPWTLHLPGAFSAAAGGRVGGRYGRIFLFCWIVPTVVIMTLAITKLPHYILFIWPALALAVAGTIAAAQQDKLTERDRIWLRRGVWFFAPPAILTVLGLIIGPWFVKIAGLRWPALASAVVLSIMTVIAVRRQRANRPQDSAGILLAGMFIFMIPVLFGVLPAVEQVKLSPPIARAVKAATTEDIPVAVYKYREPNLYFYIGRKIETLRSEVDVVNWAKQPGSGVLIIPDDILNQIRQKYGVLPLDEIASKEGFNYSKNETLKLVALARNKGNND